LGVYVDDYGGFGDFFFRAGVDDGSEGLAEGAAVRRFQHELEAVVTAEAGERSSGRA
jgi:hypothetical protein